MEVSYDEENLMFSSSTSLNQLGQAIAWLKFEIKGGNFLIETDYSGTVPTIIASMTTALNWVSIPNTIQDGPGQISYILGPGVYYHHIFYKWPPGPSDPNPRTAQGTVKFIPLP